MSIQVLSPNLEQSTMYEAEDLLLCSHLKKRHGHMTIFVF